MHGPLNVKIPINLQAALAVLAHLADGLALT